MSFIETCGSRVVSLISPNQSASMGDWLKVVGKDALYGTVGLFVIDVAWRIMDVGIDFICNHIWWLHWLAS